MRMQLVGLTAALLLGAAVVGCGSQNAPFSAAGPPNDAGGGSNPTVGAGSATPLPATAVAPVLIDDGSELAGASPAASATPTVYKQLLGGASTEKQSPLNSVSDASSPAPYPTLPPEPSGSADAGSHLVTFTGSNLQQIILQSTAVLPALAYTVTSATPSTLPATFTYSTIVLHLAYAAGTTSPGTFASANPVSVEVTGAIAGGSAFDVRVACKGAPGAAPAFAASTCGPLPALGTASSTSFANPLAPGVTGGYDPTPAFAPHLAIVLSYAAPTPLGSTGNTLLIDNVYATR